MSDIDTLEISPMVPEVVEQIRKPEARSPYSDALAATMQNYLGEIFEQPQHSKVVDELKQRNGLILFEGSILRGTASEKTHDFDFFVLADDQPIDSELFGELSVFTRDIEDYHPENLPFADYLIRGLQSEPNLRSLYDSRVRELQRRKDYTDRKYARTPSAIEVRPHNIVHVDSQFDKLGNLVEAIDNGDDSNLIDNETPSRVIVTILTATPDLVYETVPGALLYHQKRIVEALRRLKDDSPEKFNSFYSQLESDFANLHRSTAWRYPERDFRLLAEYYLRAGRFSHQHIPNDKLVDIVSRRLGNSAILEDYESWLDKYTEYKNDPELLVEHMTKKYGLETGLGKEDIERISRGEDLLAQEVANLSPEAAEEVENFEKRVRLLAAVRRQIKMPTLEQLEEAYLRPE